MLDGDNTIFGNSHRHFVPPRSLGKTSKDGDLIYSLAMNKLQENAPHFLQIGDAGVVIGQMSQIGPIH